MSDLAKNETIEFLDFSHLKKMFFLCVCLLPLLHCSVAMAAAPEPSVDLSKLQFMKPSDDKGLARNSATTDESSLGETLKKIIQENSSGSRLRRNSWNFSEQSLQNRFHKGTNAQHNSFANFYQSSNDDELKLSNLYLLLAQQEAKCLHEFGELKPGIFSEFPQDLFRPFVCLPGPQNFSACEQCVELVQKVSMDDTISEPVSCQSSCRTSSALPNCTERCAEVIQSLINGMEKVEKDAVAIRSEWDAEGRCKTTGCNLRFPTSQVNRRGSATSGVSKDANTLTSNVFCEGVTQPLSKMKSGSHSMLNGSLQSSPNVSNYRHFVYLKSLLSDRADGLEAAKKVPVVFVIEQREYQVVVRGSKDHVKGNWTTWRVLGKSPCGLDKIRVAYRQQTYQWRVTAVGVQGPLAVSVVKSFETLDGYMEPGPPERVFVIEKKPKESTVDVLVGWDPPRERACFYKIVLETRNEEESSRTVRIKGEPLGVHKVWFRGLRLDSTYEVLITSRSAEWHEDESTHASLSFTTPACLDAHQFRFDKCAPPPPRNLSYRIQAESSSKVMDILGKPKPSFKRHFTAHLEWEPPAHTSRKNLIQRYVVEIRAFSWNLRRSDQNNNKDTDVESEFLDPQELLAPTRINLPGNVTHVKVESLDMTAEYTVLVSAVSTKGASLPATLTIKLHSEMGSLDTTMAYWIYPCGVLVTVLVIASGCQALRTLRTRRQIKAARDSYFKSIDQRDAYTDDWSVVSLTEDPNRTWKVLEENSFPKAKWHVGFQDLTIGDIIGQGAFGIVRKAKIRSDKFLELQKRHNRKNLDSKYQVCSSELGNDETGMETVALKMLRVAARKGNKEDLMEELMTMQSLGVHPQIVTLLGVCTTPKSMYLVLEYCPGGDLLSFLRKFREKYLPLLNLECGSRKGGWFGDLESKSLSHVDDRMNRSSSGIGCEREQVCYTDLHHNEISSSSPELSDEMQAAVEVETGTGTSMGREEGACDYECVREKDVLSYAQQIALGMAYLERNHIIHRDLACRNILVMGDHKRVKISDFGLSRDIYTWNVYEQKTTGKMPIKWMALESIASRIFTSKSDVWSYGIVLWELITLGAVPYPALENQQLFNMLRSGYRMERPDNCSEELYALMRKCWRTSPADRPNFLELISYLETMLNTEAVLYLTLKP